MADLAVDWWSLRAGIALEPKYANLAQFDWRVGKSHGLMAEYETRYAIGRLQGATSALVFLNEARMGSYNQVNANRAAYDNDVAATRADGRPIVLRGASARRLRSRDAMAIAWR
jgi:hypothetical protein